MKRIFQSVLISLLLIVPQTSSGSTVLVPDKSVVFYEVLPYWKQTMTFPRWRDTYEIVFEQEMLA